LRAPFVPSLVNVLVLPFAFLISGFYPLLYVPRAFDLISLARLPQIRVFPLRPHGTLEPGLFRLFFRILRGRQTQSGYVLHCSAGLPSTYPPFSRREDTLVRIPHLFFFGRGGFYPRFRFRSRTEPDGGTHPLENLLSGFLPWFRDFALFGNFAFSALY